MSNETVRGPYGSVLLGWSYQRLALDDLERLAEGRNVALTNAFANALWPRFAPLVEDSAGATADVLRQRADAAGLPATVVQHMKGTGVVKVKVYALNGVTVFSTDSRQTGEDKSNNTGFLAARAGRVRSPDWRSRAAARHRAVGRSVWPPRAGCGRGRNSPGRPSAP